ncbi:MAG: SBBP repeat-containing protein, partial [Pleurocapsa sp. MO_192.B19]|nr:SBBP repeat-containing protein [Pleurocapsa sp. MO_192.B19]
DAWVAKYDSDGNQVWIEQFGTSNSDLIRRIATDNDGNLYLTGSTGGDLAATKQGESTDAWVAKYDSDGNQVWIEQFGTDILNTPFGVDVDDDGNVYLSGLTVKQIDDEEITFPVQDDSWVIKYDSNGNQQWFREFGTPFNFDEAYDVAVDSDGNVYATGWTLGDLGGTKAGAYDAWLVKYDNDGNQEWIEQFGSAEDEFPWGAETDSQGNIYATGWTLGDLGGANAGSYDAWVAKYDSNGNQEWIEQFGTSGDDGSFVGGMEVDSNDDIFVIGYTDSNLGGANAGSYDAWVAKYDSNGNQEWIEQFGTPELDYATDVTADIAGNLYVTGFTEGSLGDTNAGSVDAWVAKLDAKSGTLQDFSGNTFDSLGVEENQFLG